MRTVLLVLRPPPGSGPLGEWCLLVQALKLVKTRSTELDLIVL